METIELKKIEIFFCNVNKAMGLSGHCHYGEVTIELKTTGEIGFPSFKNTYEEISNFVQGLNLKGFKGTNEEVLRYIHNELLCFEYKECLAYDGGFELYKTTLKVMGVQDENNHSNGFTTYRKYAV